ncbi:hypothetical protein E0198_001143 [Clavispora lusitaniae]|nr:hypothetical protein E0198_001143 [Clavispora lusitaniae]
MSNDSYYSANVDFPSVWKSRSIFSGSSRASTASSTPPVKEEIDENELGFGQAKVGLLDSVNTRALRYEETTRKAPKALESDLNHQRRFEGHRGRPSWTCAPKTKYAGAQNRKLKQPGQEEEML